MQKTFECEVKATSEDGGPTRWEAIASSKSVDRDGEILDPAGMRFVKGAPLLYGHDYGNLRANIGLVESAEPSGKKVLSAGVFDDDIPAHIDAQIAAGKAKKKRLQFLSVGFIPHALTRRDGKVITLAAGEWAWPEPGTVYNEWSMVELSFVPVPSNEGAQLISARSFEGPEGAALKAIVSKALEELLGSTEFLDRLEKARAASAKSETPPPDTQDDIERLLAGEEPLRVGMEAEAPEVVIDEIAALLESAPVGAGAAAEAA